jgi:peptidoglycan/xylan/chitin deacetylase (PgdA/CDA1 family)
LFASGLPILTYHKVGPRPWGARLKGLYVSARLYEKQMAELEAAGYRTCSPDTPAAPQEPSRRSVVVTFDDGFRNVLQHALAPLTRRGFRAVEFLVADRLGGSNDWETARGEVPAPLMDAAEVRDWLAAGQEIGSHTLTHPQLTRLPVAQAREEISASKKKLEDVFGVSVRHFCYPHGDCNEAVAEMVREAGYVSACTTRFGVNNPDISPYQLLRITARYPTRSLRRLKSWLTQRG